jgi:hypothetical protein
VLVLQEFAHVVARRRSRDVAAAAGTDLALVLSPVLPASDAHVPTAMRLFRAHPRLQASDAFLVAAALDADAEVIVTADRALHAVTEVRVVDPRDAGVGQAPG